MADFGIDLLQNIGVDRDFSTVNGAAHDELGNDLILIQKCFDGFPVFWIANDYKSKLKPFEGVAFALVYITDSIL